MSSSAKDNSSSRQAPTDREQRLDWLATVDRALTGRINALRAALGQGAGWLPAPEPVPVPVPVEPVQRIPARRGRGLAVTEYRGESMADIDRRLQERINAMRASLGKSPDWQPAAGRGEGPGDAPSARRRSGF